MIKRHPFLERNLSFKLAFSKNFTLDDIMIFKEKELKGKMKKTSIVTKMLLSAFLYTVIPLLVTGILIIYTYESLIIDFLAKKSLGFSEEIIESLSLALQEAKIQAFLTLFIVIVLTLFSNILISRNLTRPLKRLLKGTNEVAKGNLDFKIEIELNDELGKVSTQFNKMTQQLKEAKANLEKAKLALEAKVKERTKKLQKITEALEESKTILEIKVQARTQELEDLTKNLEGQVEERTKELQERLQELKNFQKFAVGRELKMMELKKELETLKKN